MEINYESLQLENQNHTQSIRTSTKKESLSERNHGDAVGNSWDERGPNNVGGRTRVVLFDPNDVGVDTKDYSRVFAVGVSGGGL